MPVVTEILDEKMLECSHPCNVSNIKFEEFGRKIFFENMERKTYLKIVVDGCLIDEGCRADYCIKCSDTNRAIVIELKGRDVEHAFSQLSRTIEALRAYWGSNVTLKAVIICNQIPKVSNLVQKLQNRFAAKFGMLVKISTHNLRCEFGQFFAR